mmetsp:Transcript_38161/g.110186  ORF Transcript_38161/g.110186 Transcript_38161/m.110186 type:complete len:300 (+) Transcript_38161:440-1339(+)
MKPSISRSRSSTAAQSADAGAPSSRARGSRERRRAERCWRKSRRTCATSEREVWRWCAARRSGVSDARTLASRARSSWVSGRSGRLERKKSASLSAVLGLRGSRAGFREPQTWMLARKHRRDSRASSRPPRLSVSSRVVPAFSCEPTTSSASRSASMCVVMTDCTTSPCSSSHRMSTELFRTSPRGQEPTSRCVSSSSSSTRASGSTCGLPTMGWRAGRLAWQQLIVHAMPSGTGSSLSMMPMSVSKKAQASARRWILSSPKARRSAGGTCKTVSIATPVRKEAMSGTVASLGSQIKTL